MAGTPEDDGPVLERPIGAPKLYEQDGRGYEAVVVAHYFLGSSDWLVTEYDPGEDIAFGWACLSGDRQNTELGYTSLAELASVRLPLTIELRGKQVIVPGVMAVEKELDWPAGKTLTEAIEELDRRHGR